MKKIIAVLVWLALAIQCQPVLAQGDGPRVFMHMPTGISPVSLTWMDLDSNMNFAGNILVPQADIQTSIWALNYNHTFELNDRMAEFWVTGIGGDLSATLSDPGLGLLRTSTSGIADPYFAMRVGLIGASAYRPAEFAKHPPEFSMWLLTGANLPWGEYDASRPLNLGTNRWSARLGLPMSVPIGEHGTTWLELNPSVYFYGDNDEPFRADKREQDALYVAEAHLSHNFTPRFWGSVDIRYRHGGETTTDGLSDDNQMNQWGGGISLGYTFSQRWSGFFGYGEIFGERDGSRADMWRARLIYVF